MQNIRKMRITGIILFNMWYQSCKGSYHTVQADQNVFFKLFNGLFNQLFIDYLNFNWSFTTTYLVVTHTHIRSNHTVIYMC